MLPLLAPDRLESYFTADAPHMLAVPPAEVDRVWHLVAPILARAILRTRKITLEDAHELCTVGACQLWVVWFPQEGEDGEALGALMTDIQAYPSGWRVARIFVLAGEEFARWSHLLIDIEAWAVAEGCQALEMIGRKGWGRVFPEYRPIEYVYSKEL